ncbi:transposase [Streptomyces spectabilis]|uniref:transposase n=1 Tax=Streptomyces spectabilis TaxID=68270 RepID=UPI0033FAE3C0
MCECSAVDRGRRLVGADRAAAAALAGEVAGPRPVDDRLCLQGILYVLHNGIAWQPLALEPGFGSGQTCRRRRERWQQAEVFHRPHRILPAERNTAGEPDRSRACVHGTPSARKTRGQPTPTRPRPVGQRKTGSKHHPACDGKGAPSKGSSPPRPTSTTSPRPSPSPTAPRPRPPRPPRPPAPPTRLAARCSVLGARCSVLGARCSVLGAR